MPLKILHTADWHLGKRLGRFHRLEEQRDAMDKICLLADEHGVDVVLIAGDIFDHFNPDTASTELFFQTAKRLSNNGKRAVLVIAGNHDSGEGLHAPNPLARANGIVLIGQPFQELRPFELETGLKMESPAAGVVKFTLPTSRETVTVIATPYTNEYRLKQALHQDNKEAELRDVLKEKWAGQASHLDSQGANILMTHLFVVKQGEKLPEEPSDEKPILEVGGTQAIYTHCFPDHLDYVALGHLHGYREVGGKKYPIVYASSPLQYSFGESGKTGQVVILEWEQGKELAYNPIALGVGKPLLRYTAQGLDNAVEWLNQNQNALVELGVESDQYLTALDRQRLHESHEGIVSIIPILSSDLASSEPEGKHKLDLKLGREKLFYQYFESRHGQPPGEDIKALFKEILGGSES